MFVPLFIVGSLIREAVNLSIHFEYEAVFRAVEIDDEPVDNLLATKFQTQNAAVAQQRPGARLGIRWRLPK
ncbi:MAG TPA: hypothetical protein VFU03_11455, partial [Gemmatimonadales bacterium]|nr:hypothetical protein [Gemmatimonadales bacterium]